MHPRIDQSGALRGVDSSNKYIAKTWVLMFSKLNYMVLIEFFIEYEGEV